MSNIFLSGMPSLSPLSPAGEMQQIPALATPHTAGNRFLSACSEQPLGSSSPRPFPSLEGKITQEGDIMPPSVGFPASCSVRGLPTHCPGRSAPDLSCLAPGSGEGGFLYQEVPCSVQFQDPHRFPCFQAILVSSRASLPTTKAPGWEREP